MLAIDPSAEQLPDEWKVVRLAAQPATTKPMKTVAGVSGTLMKNDVLEATSLGSLEHLLEC